MAKRYDASDIQVLEGLDAVRMRPGMYIGSTGARGLHHMIWEIVDNAIDEAANGYATEVSVTLYKDGSCEVTDNGRGVPVGIHPKLGVSAVEVVYTQLHAGGKFNNENYAYSGGLHGVGASVVNALSEWLVCEVYSDFSLYRQEFASVVDEKTGKMYTVHWATSPRHYMQETCLTCHKDKTAEQMNKAIDAMKGHYDGKVREAEARMNDMFNAFELAIASGVDEKTLDEARKLHSSAHINWEYWTAVNGAYFHNPEEAQRSLAKSAKAASDATALLRKAIAAKASAKAGK